MLININLLLHYDKVVFQIHISDPGGCLRYVRSKSRHQRA